MAFINVEKIYLPALFIENRNYRRIEPDVACTSTPSLFLQ